MEEDPKIWLDDSFFSWVVRQTLQGLKWLHDKSKFHGLLKQASILAFPGLHAPHIKSEDLGSCLDLSLLGVDDMARTNRCISTDEYAAPEMLMAGIPHADDNKPIAVGRSADLYCWGS